MTFNGLHTSLYAQYPSDVARPVENAIWLKITGQSAAARMIYNKELSLYWNEPLIAIERADLELECGRWGRAWRILDSALANSRTVGANLDLPEYRLMLLEWAMVGIRHRGDVECVPVELERTWHWLEKVPVSDYTDIQWKASCIRRYVIAYLLLRLCTSYRNDKLESVPMDEITETPGAAIPWNGLHLLRRSLTARGMFKEANAVFRPELNRTPPKDRQPIIQEFLDTISETPSLRQKDWIESVVRLQWSDTYVQLHNAPGASEELAKAECAFNRWCENNGIREIFVVPHFQSVLVQRMELCGDHSTRLRIAEQCMAVFEQIGNAKLGSCISTATDSAHALYESTGEEVYLKKFFALHKQLEEFDENVSEDLCDLVRHRSSLISVTTTNLVDRQKSLEWIAGFFRRYPYFASPGELEQLYRQRSLLLRGLQRLDEARQAEDIADKLKNSGPVIGKWLHMSPSVMTSSADPVSINYDSEDDEDIFFYNSFPISKLKDPAATIATVVEHLLDWIMEDVKSGRLDAPSSRLLLGTSKEAIGGGLDKKPDATKTLGRIHLLSFLIPDPLDDNSAQEEKRSMLYNWLSQPPKGQRNKRLYCLILVRNSRQFLLSDHSTCDSRISELKQLLDMEENLPHQIKEVCSSAFRNGYAHLAGSYFAKLGDDPDLRSRSVYATLLEAELYCDQAVTKLRSHQPELLASQLRLSARIHLTKIRRLELQLADSRQSTSTGRIEDEIRDLRTAGLSRIREAEQIYTSSELLSSWLDDLDGVHQRRRISHFQLNAYTAFVAFNLLLTEPGSLSPETLEECWEWVQKFKARSLTQTIGLRTPIPKELGAQILESERARPLYEEMLRLQTQIDSAEQSSRFDLRQRMEALRKRMKEDPLLRRLIDLREGSPLTLVDITALQKDAGSPIVLVDWFYLPRYPDESKGSFLLLTARATGEKSLDVLSTTFQDVYTWASQDLNPNKLRFMEARYRFNVSLSGLVTPLARRTKEGEVLLFCPSSTLHRLPLHALPVRDPETDMFETLIHRNPVVYIHAHSLLRTCFSAAERARESRIPLKPQIISGIPKADMIDGRYQAGRESIATIASLLNTTPLMDESATKWEFCSKAIHSRLLHIHTHCNFDYTNPLDHHITFPRFLDERGHDSDYKLTAKELFDIRLVPGTHVNLIACSGGVTDIQLGDEVMGLVPALLYSGASSTVSTLWPIGDGDGAVFAQGFFNSFIEQCMEGREALASPLDDDLQSLSLDENYIRTKNRRPSVVDLALALQDAVMQMDEHQDEPLVKWAGFVLHGYWRFPVHCED